MKKWWFGEKKHLDQAKIDQERQTLKDLSELIDNHDLDGYVALMKALNPEIKAEDLRKAIELFHAQCAERSGLRRGGGD